MVIFIIDLNLSKTNIDLTISSSVELIKCWLNLFQFNNSLQTVKNFYSLYHNNL